MKDQSIRKLTLKECRLLSEVMGFCKESLDDYEGRYVKIKLISPKRIDSWDGVFVHMNENKGKRGRP
jgi:hypothetical protein